MLIITNKDLKARINAAIGPDKIKIQRDGRVLVFRSYFYRFGQSSEQWAESVAKKMPFLQLLDSEDRYASWPKTSYYVGIFRYKG